MRVRRVLLSSSVLDADFYDIRRQVEEAVRGGVDVLHFDVADTSFTPTVSFGPRLVSSVLRGAGVPGEVHLMVRRPEQLVEQLPSALRAYFHVEASHTPFRVIQQLSDVGIKPGVALSPATRVERVEHLIPHLEAVLVLLVEPGLGGQRMMRGLLRKVSQLRELREREGYSYLIAVDGGVKPENVTEVVLAGADVVVVGSAIFASDDPRAAASEVKARILKALGLQG